MENIKLQPGDYTTREEIEAYAEREVIDLEQAYMRICDAFVAGGADIGEGVEYTRRNLTNYGWCGDKRFKYNSIYFDYETEPFTRHLTPEQILNAGKQEGLQSEKLHTDQDTIASLLRIVERQAATIETLMAALAEQGDEDEHDDMAVRSQYLSSR